MRIGICAPRSLTKSNRPPATSGSRLRAQNSRTFDSSSFIFLGVKTRDSSPRWMSWIGGSSKRISPGGSSTFALMISRMSLRPELNVSQSIRPCSTSSKRLNA